MEEKDKKSKKEPTVAPGMEGDPTGEDATREDKKKGNVTRVTRVFADENDSSRG